MFFVLLLCYVFVCSRHSSSNRVEAWTRDVQFLLRQEGRPVTQLVGNMSTIRIMRKDWQNTDKAAQWIHQRARSSDQPFALYLGLNLPHPYKTESLGPTAGGSTFLASPYWLKKAFSFTSQYISTSSTWLDAESAFLIVYSGVFRAHHYSQMAPKGCNAPRRLLFYSY